MHVLFLPLKITHSFAESGLAFAHQLVEYFSNLIAFFLIYTLKKEYYLIKISGNQNCILAANLTNVKKIAPIYVSKIARFSFINQLNFPVTHYSLVMNARRRRSISIVKHKFMSYLDSTQQILEEKREIKRKCELLLKIYDEVSLVFTL